MRRCTILLSLLALIALGGSVAAQAPDPTLDLDEKFMGCRPGCDLVDYKFEVKNTSTTHDYTVRITGTPTLDDPCRTNCCGGVACQNEFTGEEQIIEAGGCEGGRMMDYPQFPNCYPVDCSCDNVNVATECFPGDDCTRVFCATVEDPMVVVTQWKAVYEEDWHQYTPPIVLCEGRKGRGKSSASLCTVDTFCTGSYGGPCEIQFLCF